MDLIRVSNWKDATIMASSMRQTIRGITFRHGTPVHLTGAIDMDGGPRLEGAASNVGEMSFAVPIDRKGNGGTVSLSCDGMTQPWSARIVTSTLNDDGAEMNVIQPIELEPSAAPFPSGVVNRGPLPPFPPEPPTYDQTFWYPSPLVAEKRYWRCNFGCVTIPGLPWVDGMESRNYDRLLTGFFGRYEASWQETIIATYQQRGYTHFLRWVQDEMSVPGFSIEKYVSECQALKAGGVPFLAHSFLSKTYSPMFPDVDYCRATFGPLIAALKAADCLDLCIVGFELNLFVGAGDPINAIIDYFTQECGLNEGAGCPAYVHFTSEVTWWGQDGTNRAIWWNLQVGKLTGLLYQSDPAWPVWLAQQHYRDSTDVAAGFPGRDSGFGHDFDFVALETQLERAFGDGADLNEDDLDQMGYLSLCTNGQLPVMGFGCGCRRPDGSYV